VLLTRGARCAHDSRAISAAVAATQQLPFAWRLPFTAAQPSVAAAVCTTARSTSSAATSVGAHRVDGDPDQRRCDAIGAAVRRLGRGGVHVPG
jgi:hypothetical protein